ncbi:MAG: MYXO-CTERM sorting domain-containing protein [Byssovorax sp.]
MRTFRRLSALSAALLSLTLAGAAVAANPSMATRSGRFPIVGVALGQRAPNVVLEKAAPAVAFEQVRWAHPVSFGAARTVELANGERVVKLPQVHQGLYVAMRGVAVTFGNDTANLVTAKLEEDLPSSVTPAIGATDAAAAATLATGLTMDPTRAILMLWPTADGAKLVWGIDATAILGLPYQPVVIVDAQTGEVILKYNAITSVNGAKVYPSNPLKSPGLINVTLPVGAADTTLQNELIVSRNCIDTHEAVSVMGLQIHSCKLLQTAKPDPNGDYVIAVAGDKDPEDSFSEVSMFYHTNRIYDFFRGFGPTLDVNPGSPLPAISNLRLPQGLATFDLAKLQDKNLPLDPFQNAFFSPANPLFQAAFEVNGNAMWFGQGPLKDYSYDGDVIYHEFTHAVVNVTLNLAQTPHMDEFGTSYSPGGMNEGLADYFSSALTGDPDVGEYATQDFAPGAPFIRSLANPDTCPSAVGGEVHQDATMFSGALWDTRKTLAVDQQAELDKAVFSAMNKSATGDLGYEDFAKLILNAVTSSPLGAAGAQKLSDAFTARGLLPRCSRLLEYKGTTLSGPKDLQGLWFAPGTQTTGVKNTKGWTPGVVQIHNALPAGATNLTVTFTSVALGGGGGIGGGGGTAFTPQIMVRFSKDPIQFKYKPLTAQAENVLVDATKSGSTYTASIPVPAGSAEAYVMVVSSGETDGAYTKLALVTDSVVEPTTSTGTGVGGGSTTSTTTGAGGGADGGEDEVVGGCGCSVPGAGEKSTAAAIAAIAALGLVASRRRRR